LMQVIGKSALTRKHAVLRSYSHSVKSFEISPCALTSLRSEFGLARFTLS
jgi:hypothetical protein